MKNQIFTLIAIVFMAFSMTSCDVDQTREAKMPDVDVSVDEGQMPAFDVDWADVNIGTRTQTVKVPKVRVVMEEEEVQVPYVDVEMPNSEGKEELTLVAEAEVGGESHDLDIVEVYATGDRLYVISELEKTGQDLEDERMRVSDRVIINAPDDLNVKHYIIGDRPDGSFNRQYSYVASIDDIKGKLNKGKVIYKK